MKFKEKKILLLDELYNRRFDGLRYRAESLMSKYDCNREESLKLAKSLKSEGYISLTQTKEGNYVQIEYAGIEFLEDMESAIPLKEYQPKDYFTSEDKKEIFKRLDLMNQQLVKIQLGQEITYNDLYDEISELKALTNILGKKDWIQILKGKLIDLGFGTISERVAKIVIESFKDYYLLEN
jgi:hypothetical protein